ncbi:MAG: hypothetical protein R3E12_05140 [Candidatus Eisenbacteria bacterium]
MRWLPLGVAIYCVVTLGYVHQRVEQRLEADLDQNIREQNIFANYYQAPGFRPLDTCRALAAQVAAHPGTVVLANELDRVSWTFYLQKFDIPSYALAQFKEDNTSGATHTGVFQLARGRDGERVFLQWSMRIPEPFDSGDRLTPVMLYLASYDPADVIYVVTGLNRLIEQVVTTRYPEFRMGHFEVP